METEPPPLNGPHILYLSLAYGVPYDAAPTTSAMLSFLFGPERPLGDLPNQLNQPPQLQIT
jgi:hypothetical protein